VKVTAPVRAARRQKGAFDLFARSRADFLRQSPASQALAPQFLGFRFMPRATNPRPCNTPPCDIADLGDAARRRPFRSETIAVLGALPESSRRRMTSPAAPESGFDQDRANCVVDRLLAGERVRTDSSRALWSACDQGGIQYSRAAWHAGRSTGQRWIRDSRLPLTMPRHTHRSPRARRCLTRRHDCNSRPGRCNGDAGARGRNGDARVPGGYYVTLDPPGPRATTPPACPYAETPYPALGPFGTEV